MFSLVLTTQIHPSVQVSCRLKLPRGSSSGDLMDFTCQQCCQHCSWPRLLPPPLSGCPLSFPQTPPFWSSYIPFFRPKKHPSTSKFCLEAFIQWPLSTSRSLALRASSGICISCFHSVVFLLCCLHTVREKIQLHNQSFLSLSSKPLQRHSFPYLV